MEDMSNPGPSTFLDDFRHVQVFVLFPVGHRFEFFGPRKSFTLASITASAIHGRKISTNIFHIVYVDWFITALLYSGTSECMNIFRHGPHHPKKFCVILIEV